MSDSSKNLPWTLFPAWMNAIDSEKWKKKIKDNLKWEQPLVRVYGSSHVVPRMTTFLAEKNINYRYSGLIHYGNGWPNWFCPLLMMVTSACKANFNGCLINLYRNGNDRMGWHSDDEYEINSTEPIASLSFGASRDFFFKHRNENVKKVLSLHDGDLLVMHPSCQENWIHSLPMRKRIDKARINLTFRCYKKNF